METRLERKNRHSDGEGRRNLSASIHGFVFVTSQLKRIPPKRVSAIFFEDFFAVTKKLLHLHRNTSSLWGRIALHNKTAFADALFLVLLNLRNSILTSIKNIAEVDATGRYNASR